MANPFQTQSSKLESALAGVFAKAPHIPDNARQGLVQFAPWLALIGGVLGIASVWSAGFIASFFAFKFMMYGSQGIWTVTMLLMLLASVLDLMAFKPLSEKKKKGWNYLFIGMLLATLSTVLQLAFSSYGSVGAVIGLIIGFWLLFEIRGMYR